MYKILLIDILRSINADSQLVHDIKMFKYKCLLCKTLKRHNTSALPNVRTSYSIMIKQETTNT